MSTPTLREAAAKINDYLHTLEVLQPLAWHLARGLSEPGQEVNGTPSAAYLDAAKAAQAWIITSASAGADTGGGV